MSRAHRNSGFQRRPRPAALIDRALQVFSDDPAEMVVRVLNEAGWHIIPLRRPYDRGVDDEDGQRLRSIRAHDGAITARQLVEAAAEFDSIMPGAEVTASDFAAWWLREIAGTRENEWANHYRNGADQRVLIHEPSTVD